MGSNVKKVRVNSDYEARIFLDKAKELGYKWGNNKRENKSYDKLRLFVLDNNGKLGYFNKLENFENATSITELELKDFLSINGKQ